MRGSLQPSPVPDLSPETKSRFRRLLVAEAHDLAARGEEDVALIAQRASLTDVDSVLERELAETGLARARETLADIQNALQRLAMGGYGSCESCGLPVPLERLEAIPSARLCVACTGRRVGRPR